MSVSAPSQLTRNLLEQYDVITVKPFCCSREVDKARTCRWVRHCHALRGGPTSSVYALHSSEATSLSWSKCRETDESNSPEQPQFSDPSFKASKKQKTEACATQMAALPSPDFPHPGIYVWFTKRSHASKNNPRVLSAGCAFYDTIPIGHALGTDKDKQAPIYPDGVAQSFDSWCPHGSPVN